MLRNILQNLAVTTTGVAVLVSIGTTPASAADLTLSGKFGSYFDSPLDNGSFDGVYSLRGLPENSGSSLVIDSFLVNLRDATGAIVASLNSQDPGSSGYISSYSGYDDLSLGDGNSTIDLNFDSGFRGTGSVTPTPTNLFSRDFPSLASANGVFANVASGVSVPVPEPSNLGDMAVAALGAVWLVKKKIATS